MSNVIISKVEGVINIIRKSFNESLVILNVLLMFFGVILFLSYYSNKVDEHNIIIYESTKNAISLQQSGNYEEALLIYNSINGERILNRSFDYYVNYAVSLYNQNQTKDSLVYFNKAIEIYPGIIRDKSFYNFYKKVEGDQNSGE